LPGDDLRKRLGIPLDATVELTVRRYDAVIGWYDPDKWCGVFGAGQDEFLGGTDVQYARRLASQPGRSGFVEIDPELWAAAHPTIVNPLIEAPGVSPDKIIAIEEALDPPAPVEEKSAPALTFEEPRSWDRLDWNSKAAHAKRERDFLKMFPENQLDVPRDFTRGSDGYHLGVMTPRQYAVDQLSLWGIGCHKHHGEAERLADRCGVTLVAEETCPMQPPRDGKGNPEYLLDYRVDGLPIVSFGLDLNTHQLFAWPADNRDHKHGWDNMPVHIGYDEFRHNWQNWVVARMGWERESSGTKRYDDIYLDFDAPRNAEDAQASVATVATFLLRAGHDGDALLYYDQDGKQVQTTVRKAATGHVARPAPPSQVVNEVGQGYLSKIVGPYNRWAHQSVLSDTPQSRRAANELYRAANEMKGLLVASSLPVDSDLERRMDAFIDRRQQWPTDFQGMMVEFSLIKQALHQQMRIDHERFSRYGAGFVDQFTG